MPKLSAFITIHHRVVHAVAVPVETLREVWYLDKRVGREEASYRGVVEACVGVDGLEQVVVLVAGEAAAEGEGGLRLGGVPRRVGHAVAPGVEVGLLDGVPVPVQHLLPASEVVGEHVVEAVRGAVPHMDGHHPPLGVDVVELTVFLLDAKALKLFYVFNDDICNFIFFE